MYKSLVAADHADVNRHALIIYTTHFSEVASSVIINKLADGRDLILAFCMAMTKGEDAAVPSLRLRP